MSVPAPHIVLFDLYTGGHHQFYLYHLARYWIAHSPSGRLDLVLPPQALEAYPPLRALLDTHAGSTLRFVPIEEPYSTKRERPFELIRNDLDHGRLFARYLRRLRPNHGVLMYLDHAQLSLALRLRFPFPVCLSGILFRPTLHYLHLSETSAPDTWKARLQHNRKRWLLQAARRNPHLHRLFCLDPYAVPAVNDLPGHARAVFLPDGIPLSPPSRSAEAIRARWQVHPHQSVALLFGLITRRKGVLQTLDALHALPPDVQRRLCLVFAGRIPPSERPYLLPPLERAHRETAATVIVDDRHIPDEDIQDLIRAADLVLVPYQHHVGSSGVLIRAAAEQVPVLGQDYGLLGQDIRQHRLGLAVDTTQPAALADGLIRFLTAPDTFPGDAHFMRRYAEQHQIDHFAETFFLHLLDRP